MQTTGEAKQAEASPAHGWRDDAWQEAAALLARLGLAAGEAEIAAVLQLALWRRGCRDLLAAAGPADPQANDAPDAALAAMPESVLLGLLADSGPGLALQLSRACTIDAAEARLAGLANAVRKGRLVLDPARAEADIAALQAGLGPEAIAEAASDPHFLLQVRLAPGGIADAGAIPDALMLANSGHAIEAAPHAAAAALLEEAGNQDGAAIFRQAELVAIGASASLDPAAPRLDPARADSVIAAMDRARAGLLAHGSRLARFAAQQGIALREMLASVTPDPAARRAHVEAALAALPGEYAALRDTDQPIANALATEARLVWMLAQSFADEPAAVAAQAQAQAITRLHVLAATAVAEPLLIPRLSTMAGLALGLGNALYETGRFAAAADQAVLALELVGQARAIYDQAVSGGADLPDHVVRFVRAGLDAQAAQARRIARIARARAAEAAGRLEEAAGLYEAAAAAEQEMKTHIAEVLERMFGEARGRGQLLAQVAEAGARAALFAGMSLLSQGDAALRDRRHEEAEALYAQARARNQEAADAWADAARHAPPGSAAAAASLHAGIALLRARFCDCKIALGQAEALTEAGQHVGAALKFLTARSVLDELAASSREVDDARNLRLIEASARYADARHLFAIDLDAQATSSLARARARMSEAALAFAEAGEPRWADFVRAMLAELEQRVLRAASETLPEETGRVLQEAGLLAAAPAAPAAAVLPNPRTAMDAAAARVGQAPPSADEMRRQTLRARHAGLTRTLAELAELRERGRLQAPDYLAMYNDYTTQLSEVQLELTGEPA